MHLTEISDRSLYPQVNSALHPSRVAKSSTSFGWGKGGNFTSAGWQVTLCDPIWHVSSRSGVATLRTAIHLLLTYLPDLMDIGMNYRGRVTSKSYSLAKNLHGSQDQEGSQPTNQWRINHDANDAMAWGPPLKTAARGAPFHGRLSSFFR